jgi:glycosyltransferase involved in cell wall biosynthesis
MTSKPALDSYSGCIAIVAAHNEEDTIDQVVAGARSVVPAVVVVDDGSTDRTGERARSAGAIVIRHDECLGYDRALFSGFSYANVQGFDYMVTLDGDGQHDPRSLVDLLLPLVRREADLVIGCRPRMARISERLFAAYATWRFGLRDPLCGMKGYRVALFSGGDVPGFQGSVGTGLALRAIREQARFAQVPIPLRERRDAPRMGSSMSANMRILKALCIAIWCVR